MGKSNCHRELDYSINDESASPEALFNSLYFWGRAGSGSTELDVVGGWDLVEQKEEVCYGVIDFTGNRTFS